MDYTLEFVSVVGDKVLTDIRMEPGVDILPVLRVVE